MAQTANIFVQDAEDVPVVDAVISINEQTFFTDAQGRAVVPVGGISVVVVSKIGFEIYGDTLDLQENRSFYFTLVRSATLLEEVLITGSYNEEVSIHPAVTVIPSQEIESKGATNLKEVLAHETGLRLSQDAILGSSMTINGISGQNVKFLVDGLPMIGRLNGNIDLSQVMLTNVSRIELVEGPLSVSYGTDALGGTINVITRKDQERQLEGSAFGLYESVGQYNVGAQLGYKKHRNRCGVILNRNFFDGWSEEDTTRSKEWKPREQYFAQAYYDRLFGRSSLRFKSDYFTERILNRGNPRAPYFETAFDDWYRTKRFNNALLFSSQFGKHYRVEAVAGYNRYQRIKNTYFKNLVDLTEELTATPGDQDTSVFGLITSRGTWSITPDSGKVHAQLGYDVNFETAEGERIEDGAQDISDIALFGSLRWMPTEKIAIQPGVRVAYNSDYDHPVVPSLNTKFDLANNLVLRATYARGFRSPELKELYFYFVDINHNIVGNTDLKAESSNHTSASLVWSKPAEKVTPIVKLNSYFNDIRNLITLAQVDSDQFSYVNIGEYKTVGGRISTLLQNNKWSSELAVALTAGRSDETWTTAPEVSLQTTYKIAPWNVSLHGYYKFTGETTSFTVDETGSTTEQSVAAYHTADVTVNKSFAGSRITAVGGVKNLFDVTDIAINGAGGVHGSASNQLIAWGRTVFLSLKVKLGHD